MSTRLDLSSLSCGDAVEAKKSDSTEVNFCGLYIGGEGDVVVKGRSGVAVTFKAVPAGTFINMNVNRVMDATTATFILGLVP